MTFARPGRARLLTGVLAAALIIDMAGTTLPARAAGIDPMTTASINPAQPAATPSQGSPPFRQALALVTARKYADAYTLARSLDNTVERRTVEWAAIYYGGTDIDYDTITHFEADAPDYASASLYRTRIEQSLLKLAPPPAEVIRVLGGKMPVTLKAQIALAQAYVQTGQHDRATAIARDLWVNDFLDKDTEAEVLATLGPLLDRDAHWARAVHLMMNDRAPGVERIMQFLTPAQKSLALARNAVSRNADNAKVLLDAVDPAYRDNPVFIYSQAQQAREADLDDSALDWLNKAKGELPDAANWWYERRTLIRGLLNVGNPKLAYKAAATYVHGPEGRLVEAHFLAGWISLSFLNDAKSAEAQFVAMRKLATLPDSVTQADYWLGRARTQLGDHAGAKTALTEAAGYGTIYYGLLARETLGQKGAQIRGLPDSTKSEMTFASREVVQAVQLLAANGQGALASPLLRNLADKLTDSGEMVLAARLAQSIGAHNVAILIADAAEKRGTPMDLFNFPEDGLPAGAKLADIDKAAVYAIARQESRFQVDAVSGAGARGLMQLMPSTAKETAAKLGIDYSANRLVTDAAYNATLGSNYLAAQLNRFEGSLALAAVAYNAGGGNASKWIAAYGDPRAANVDPVVWVELIPYEETRKYVQRVLGNYLVYRARLGDKTMTITQAIRQIPD
ncbi:MAG TPA: lytic transglycosylase domain-containing protein [Devosiaceae bacterium]|jgi:soluble lytic murein transglycosylase